MFGASKGAIDERATSFEAKLSLSTLFEALKKWSSGNVLRKIDAIILAIKGSILHSVVPFNDQAPLGLIFLLGRRSLPNKVRIGKHHRKHINDKSQRNKHLRKKKKVTDYKQTTNTINKQTQY